MFKEYRYRRREKLPFVPSEVAGVFEVGCATLGFGECLKQGGPEISLWAIGPHPGDDLAGHYEEIAIGFEPHDLHVEVAFDCVNFNDVLERDQGLGFSGELGPLRKASRYRFDDFQARQYAGPVGR